MRWALLAGLVVLAGSILPLAAGQGATGSTDPLRVGHASFDATTPYSDVADPEAIVFSDSDGDGTLDAGEPAYVSNARSSLDAGAVRIAHPPRGGLGSQVTPTDSDHGAAVEPLPGSIRFHDADGDEAFDATDTLFFDQDDNRRGEVSPSDLVLSGPQAGTRAQGHPLEGGTLREVTARFAVLDLDGSGSLGPGDLVAIDVGLAESALLGPRDVPLWPERFGQVGGLGDPGVVYDLESSGAPTAFIFIDSDGDGSLGLDDPVYLSDTTTQVTGSAILVGNTGEHAPGQTAGQTGYGLGNQASSVSGELRFADRDGSGDVTLADALYLDLSGQGQAFRASALDVVLTGPDAGTVVSGGYDHTGERLEDPQTGQLAYVDADGNQRQSGAEPVVWDTDQDGVLDASEPPIGVLPEERIHRPGIQRSLAAFPSQTVFAVDDGDGDRAIDHGEPVYAQLRGASGSVAARDLRVAFPANGTIGSLVGTEEGDHGAAVTTLPGGLAYRDADGDGRWDLDEHAYLDADASGNVTEGDLLMATRNATSVVGAEHPALDTALAALPSALAWMDADGTGGFSQGDAIYVDVTGTGYVTPGDLGFRSPLADRSLSDLLSPTPPTREPPEEDPADEDDPPQDPQARRDAQNAKENAREAQRAAEHASESAREAKHAAQEAREAINGTRRGVDRLAESLNASQEDERGVPGAGLVGILAAAAVALAGSARDRRRD